jgi:UDP-N-acetyl-D-mannosaminuronic acid dehydrogenase
VHEHKVFKLTDYKQAVEKADIIVFLVAHNEFKTLDIESSKVVLDFCGVTNK